jgi:uncharacterized SAM-binding protein YcdF (DUF218 family)
MPMFTTKKIIAALLLPIPISIILLIIALIAIIKFNPRLNIMCLSLALGILFLTGLNPTANLINKPLQQQYSLLQHAPQKVKTIVVLSGGSNHMHLPSANNNLSPITLCRTVEGIRLAKDIEQQKRQPLLILSGANDTGLQMQRTAILMGIPKNQTQAAPVALDTHQQALSLVKKLGTRPFILVTSATHMPRAMALFKKLKMHPIAAPTCFNYRTELSPGLVNFLPRAGSTFRFNLAWHEILGTWWGKLRGIL